MIELLLCCTGERVLGGGYNLGGNTKQRIALGLFLLSAGIVSYGVSLPIFWIVFGAWIAYAVIGHGAYMDLWKNGSRGAANGEAHEWVASFLPKEGKTARERLWIAIGGLFMVGLSRGAIVFFPVGFGWLFMQSEVSWAFWLSPLFVAFGYPFAYVLGEAGFGAEQICGYRDSNGELKVYAPDLNTNSEVFRGIGWGLAFIVPNLL